MSWARPVPLVGDASSAAERSADPTGWAFSPEDKDAFYAVVAGRRDVRRFRSDPVPTEVLRRILGAAHEAPSVGHSQPWRFLIVQSQATRDRAALMADRERCRQAAGMDDDAADRMLDLQLEGIREAPLGLVVCCDRRVPPEGVLGRATFVDADLWSCACAIQNLWLAARAEGLGVGWVTLFRPEELAALVDLPTGVDTLGWLCVGWPDERPPEPGLARAGWSIRQPLDDLVIQERWPTAGPLPPVSKVRAPGPKSVVRARDSADDLLTPPGSLGVLDRAVDRLTALGLAAGAPVHAVIAGADHPVTRYGVSTFADSVTREVLEATVAGESLGATTARSIGAGLVIVDAGVRGGPVSGARSLRPSVSPGDLVTSDALPTAEARRLLAAGRQLGLGLSPGLVTLGEVGIGNTTVASALAAAQLGLDVPQVLGLGVGGDSATLERKGEAIGKALSRSRIEHGPQLSDPLTALAALGGPEIAVLAGVALGAAEAGCLVVLDGLATSVAGVAAVGLEPAVAAHLVAGQRSRERAHGRVLSYLGLEPLLTLRLRAGEGVGAVLAVQMVLTAATVRRDVGRVGSEPRE